MEHEYFKDRISAYLDGELKNEEEQLMAEHLKGCPECQKIYQKLEALNQLVDEQAQLDDGDYWEKSALKIEKAIAKEEETEIIETKKTQWSGLGWKIGPLAAAAAVIALIMVNYEDIQKEIEPGISMMQTPHVADSLIPDTGVKQSELTIPETAKEELDKIDLDVKRENARLIGSSAEMKNLSADIPGAPVLSDDMVEEKLTEQIAEAAIADKKISKAVIMKQQEVLIAAPEITPPDKVIDETELKALTKPKEVPIAMPKLSGGDFAANSGSVDKMEASDMSVSVTVSADDEDIDIDKWRTRLDSLTTYWNNNFNRDKKKRYTSSFKTQSTTSQEETTDSDLNKNVELQLIECHFHIARLTTDKDEYQLSYDYIKKQADDTDNYYYLEAWEYLEKLESIK